MKSHRIAFAAAAALIGCATSGPRLDSALQAKALQSAAAFKTNGYRLSSSDLLSAVVYPDPQLNARARVDADGGFSLPLVGRVAIAGMTVHDAEMALERKLSDYLVEPHVTLVVEEYGSRQVYVVGAVQKPGVVPIPGGGRLTALQAIGSAGGFSNVAAENKTVLVRYTPEGGFHQILNLKKVAKGKAKSDVTLEPNDVIYVPETFF
jgi:polysaccharide export outer membrane protein